MNTKITKQTQQYTFKIGVHQGQVVMVFPQPVRDVSFNPAQAREVAELLLRNADMAGGEIILPTGMTREKPKPPGDGAGQP